MRKILWILVVLLFTLCNLGFAAETAPIRPAKNRFVPIKPLKGKLSAPTETGAPVGTVSITVVGADIRINGYTVQLRNDSSNTSGVLNVQISKGTGDKPFIASGGGMSVQSLGAGAATEVALDQPPGWNTGFTVFTVDVYEQVGAHTAVVGHRSFSIPTF
jgi:hypothetical protein